MTNLPKLPSTEAQLARLRQHGEQFDPVTKALGQLPLPGITMATGEPAIYDARTLPGIESLIVPAAGVYQAVRSARPQGRTTRTPDKLSALFRRRGIIVGFSGYGTEGYPYKIESDVMQHIFDACRKIGRTIGTVVGGGTGYGVPGLAALEGARAGHHTVGFLPLRGLRSVAPQNTAIVVGEEFGDEALALGTMVDALIVLGGEKNAEAEVRAAMSMKSTVLLAQLGKYAHKSAVYIPERNDDAKNEIKAGRVKVCKDEGEIVRALCSLPRSQLVANRARRQQQLKKILASVR